MPETPSGGGGSHPHARGSYSVTWRAAINGPQFSAEFPRAIIWAPRGHRMHSLFVGDPSLLACRSKIEVLTPILYLKGPIQHLAVQDSRDCGCP